MIKHKNKASIFTNEDLVNMINLKKRNLAL